MRRSTTTKRLDSAVPSRCRCTRANIMCEVEEPMSMPTVVNSTLSADQATSLTSSGSTWRCSNSSSCIEKPPSGRLLQVGGLVDERPHARLHPVFGEFVEIDAVDARVLILIFDLAAAVLDIDVHAGEHMALGGRERIAQPPEGDGEIARGIARGVEMLMEHLVGRREHHAVLPIDPHQVLGDSVPEQRIAVAGDGKDMEI